MTSTTQWSETAIRRLLDATTCPVCGVAELAAGRCPQCAADVSGPQGMELWNASQAAVAALRTRQAVVQRVPRARWVPVAIPTTVPAPAPAGSLADPRRPLGPAMPPPPVTASAVPSPPQSSATLQSVLAAAGAGLFAVAAIVFTYFNPELADRGLRSLIVGLVTLLFLGGAWVLAQRRLQFSAEAVGGLGLVFAGLDIHAFAQLLAPDLSPWLTTAIATVLGGGVMLVAALRAGIRIWLWTALLALATVPAMLGYAVGAPLAATYGHLGVAFAGVGIVEMLPRLAPRFRGAGVDSAADPSSETLLQPERVTLVALQILASSSAIVLVARTSSWDAAAFFLTLAGVLALVAVHAVLATRHLLPRFWSCVAGGIAAAAIVSAAYGLAARGVTDTLWIGAILTAAAALGVVVVGAMVPLPASIHRPFVAGGALTVLGAVAAVPLGIAAAVGMSAVMDFVQFAQLAQFASGGDITEPWGWAVLAALAAAAGGLVAFGLVARRRDDIRRFVRATDPIAVMLGVIVVLTFGCLRLFPLGVSVGIVLVLAAAAGMVLRYLPVVGTARPAIRIPVLVGAHLALLVAVVVSWREPAIVPVAGAATLAALVAVGAAVPARIRFLHVGVGFAYALVLVATALSQAGVRGIALLCLTASAGLAGAIVATYLPKIGARAWQAVLVVAVVPFGIGIIQVVFERSGWTALSTGLMFVLAVSLLLTRRPGLTPIVRTAAAAMPVPTLAVVIVCLGAQLLASSGSPVTLPIIAVVVALVLPSTTLIRDALAAHGLSDRSAATARTAIEGSALVTGAIAVLLAVVREASGLGTTFLVLLILGLGATASALFTRRRYAWWVAAAAYTGALWCVWGITGVDLLEAYLLPPALGAALVAALLTARGVRATGLYATGLTIAIVPLLALLVLTEPDAATAVAVPWRAFGMLAGAWLLLALAVALGKGSAPGLRRLRALKPATFAAAGLAGTAGAIQGLRFGLGADLVALQGPMLFLACLGVALLGAAALTVAATGIRSTAALDSRLRSTRWLDAPAALVLAVGTWGAIERDWFSIWAMWMLMLVFLVGVVIVAARLRRGATTLPPVWFLFGLAFVTAIVAWSPRDLRVEWFSLPLGAFLLLAGVLGMRGDARIDDPQRSPNSWPARWTGSWALLAPGIVTMMIASIVATFTDPLTWRAILVMVLALAAILVGASRRLAAPFLLGLIVLPIENVFVFAVQIGRGIESMPWWITLAVIGAVLLIIAVTYERRSGDAGSVAARLRDLR